MSRAILILGPKVTDRYALEEQKEEVHGAEDQNNCEGGVNNNSLISFAWKTKEICSDGEFRHCGWDDIEEFTDKDYL